MTGSNEDGQFQKCSWEEHDMYLVNDDGTSYTWSCIHCGYTRTLGANYVDNLFEYDGMSLAELESYAEDDIYE